MSNDFWSQEETFRDIPDEVNDQAAPPVELPKATNLAGSVVPAPSQNVSFQQEVYEEETMEVPPIDEEEEDYTAVLSDAKLRLEQGSLYQMVMNQDLFQDMDFDPRAVKNVQREIRKFAKERMEIMLGMRQEVQQNTQVVSPFNDLEVTILKKLASAASKGATESVEANKQSAPLNKKTGLTPISSKLTSQPKKEVTKLVATPKAPLVRQAQTKPKEDYKPLAKSPYEMTPEELLEANRAAAERYTKRAKGTGSLPMPSIDQEEMLHTQRALETSSTVSAIVAQINKSKQ